MDKRIILSGYGNVGRQFVKLLNEKKKCIIDNYDIDLNLCGVIGSRGCIFENDGLDLDLLLKCENGSEGIIQYGEIKKDSFYTYSVYEGDVLVDATPSDIKTGGVGLNYILEAIKDSMDVVAISKGALVTDFRNIINLSESKKVKLKYSGAVAAALPVIDLANYSLAGTNIKSIRGVLNGTSNYILNKMEVEGTSLEEALKEAQSKHIAEKDAYMDISGIDSACKIVILSNTFLNTDCSLNDVKIQGIENITKEQIEQAKSEGKVIKLVAEAVLRDNGIELKVEPEIVDKNEFLFTVNGINKGVVFHTDTMGDVGIFGGGSSPEAAAASALKDVINIYRGKK